MTLDDLPSTIVIEELTCYLQASKSPCGCWVVGYYEPINNMLPKHFYSHQRTLASAVDDLADTVHLAEMIMV